MGWYYEYFQSTSSASSLRSQATSRQLVAAPPPEPLALNKSFTMNVDQLLVSASIAAALGFFIIRKLRSRKSGAGSACSAGCGCVNKVKASGSKTASLFTDPKKAP